MGVCGKQLALRPGPGNRLVTANPHPWGNDRMEKVSLFYKRRPESGLYQLELEGKRTRNVTTQNVTMRSLKLSSILPAGDEVASDTHPGLRPTEDKAETHIENLLVGFRRRGFS